jgi:hypothetical protein
MNAIDEVLATYFDDDEEAVKLRQQAAAELAALRAENDTLRGIAAKIMPCHYCGVDEIAKCPHGFPGCALADDALNADEGAGPIIRRLRADLKEAAEVLKELWLDSCETMNWTDEFETRVTALLKRLEQP